MNEKCFYCQGREGRETLSSALLANVHLQSRHRRMPLLDHYGLYSVTGLAAAVLAPGTWVRTPNGWSWHWAESIRHPELVTEPGTNRTMYQVRLDEDDLRTLETHSGTGYVHTCPEPVFAALGIGTEVDPEYLAINRAGLTSEHRKLISTKARWLDELDFAAAGILLREAPELLGECRCGEEE